MPFSFLWCNSNIKWFWNLVWKINCENVKKKIYIWWPSVTSAQSFELFIFQPVARTLECWQQLKTVELSLPVVNSSECGLTSILLWHMLYLALTSVFLSSPSLSNHCIGKADQISDQRLLVWLRVCECVSSLSVDS